jgi:hypothetical protein
LRRNDLDPDRERCAPFVVDTDRSTLLDHTVRNALPDDFQDLQALPIRGHIKNRVLSRISNRGLLRESEGNGDAINESRSARIRDVDTDDSANATGNHGVHFINLLDECNLVGKETVGALANRGNEIADLEGIIELGDVVNLQPALLQCEESETLIVVQLNRLGPVRQPDGAVKNRLLEPAHGTAAVGILRVAIVALLEAFVEVAVPAEHG